VHHQPSPQQFEIELTSDEFSQLTDRIFAGWQVIKQTVTHQKYDIPRENGIASLETDVVTCVFRNIAM
jgi:hypothetical protein